MRKWWQRDVLQLDTVSVFRLLKLAHTLPYTEILTHTLTLPAVQTEALQYHSSYRLSDLGPLVRRLYAMLASPADENLRAVENKYSHKYVKRLCYRFSYPGFWWCFIIFFFLFAEFSLKSLKSRWFTLRRWRSRCLSLTFICLEANRHRTEICLLPCK